MSNCDIIPKDAKVILCAVSGGADSVYLLHRATAEAKINNVAVHVAHYNHKLRGKESDRDESFVKNLCRDLGVNLICESGDVAFYSKQNKIGTEEAARELRYDFLARVAKSVKADYILTAHTADDNAETILLNLTRGTGLAGLCGIPEKRDNIIRPLLKIERAEIEEYLISNSIAYIEDSSNKKSIYSRNRIRLNVMPELKMINSNVTGNISRTISLIKKDAEYMQGLADEFINEHCKNDIPCDKLSNLPEPIAARVVMQLCPTQLSETHINSVLELCKIRGTAYLDLPGIRCTVSAGRLLFFENELTKLKDYQIPQHGETFITELGRTVISSQIESFCEVNSSLNTFFFNLDSICGNIFCTSYKEGDKIRLSKRNCTKKVTDIYQEAKMPVKGRLLNPVLRDEAGPIAVINFGIAERCIPQIGKPAIKIEFI